ncbi:MAG: 30S ribosomal protein S15 [Nitrospinales bacterium]
MSLSANEKKGIISDYQIHEKDTGSSEVQIALLTQRLTDLNEHFKAHAKDHHSRRGLLKLVSQRRKLLDHLKKEDLRRYQEVISRLGIRR